jgi:hypothetical protein
MNVSKFHSSPVFTICFSKVVLTLFFPPPPSAELPSDHFAIDFPAKFSKHVLPSLLVCYAGPIVISST